MSEGNGETKNAHVMGSDGKKLIPNPKFNQNAATNNIFNNPVRPQEASIFRQSAQGGVTEESSSMQPKKSSINISKRISNSLKESGS